MRYELKAIILILICTMLLGVSLDGRLSLAAPLDEKEAVTSKIDELHQLEKEIEEELSGLNSDLLVTSESLTKAEEELSKLEEEINEKEEHINLLEDWIDEQQSGMEIRIRYMYENSYGKTLSTYLLKCTSISELLNRQEYIGAVMKYDRNKLDEYQDNLLKRESEQAELEKLYEKLEIEKETLQSDKERLLDDINDSENRLSETRLEEEAAQAELDRIINKMLMLERMYYYEKDGNLSLEEKYAMMAESEGSSGKTVYPASGEESLLAAIIFCESGGESYESQLAVGSVVLNRVNSSWFPGNITDVIYSHRQFSPVASGRLAVVLANGLTTDSCRQAAHQVLNNGVTGNWLYFRLNDGSRSGYVIGNQVFY